MEGHHESREGGIRVMEWLKNHKRLSLVILILAGVALTGIALYSADRYVFIYSGDASSHLVRTRQFVDSEHTGIHNIGTAWLPMPHLLLLPFAAIDFLFYNGLSAVIPGVALLIGAALAIFGMVRRIAGSSVIAFLCALAIGVNPNILYLSLIPMSEASFLFFFSAAAYALLRWMERPEALPWLAGCSAAICCATLSRYETWPLPGALVLISFYMMASGAIPPIRKTRVMVLLLSAASFLGIGAWLLWNLVEYGNPLEFAHAIYNIGPADSRQVLEGNPVAVVLLYAKTVLYMFGPVLFGLALAGFAGRQWSTKLSLLYAFLLLPPAFTLVSLERGFAQMDQWWWNSRYVLPIGVPLLIAGGLALKELWQNGIGRRGRMALAAALFSFSLVQVTVPSVGVITFIDAAKTFFERNFYANAVGERLGEVYGGGSIALLAGNGQGHMVMLPSRIPINRFRLVAGRDTTDTASNPWEKNRYIVLSKEPDPEARAVTDYWIRHFALLVAHYAIIDENPDYLLLERKHDRHLRVVSADAAP
jgi:4-amino-4-deoxy-L-arabinose transferase-like glycosyltransferase